MIPAWQHRLEQVEFKTKRNPQLMITWLLEHPVAQEMPDNIKKAQLAKYGYEEPKQEVVQEVPPLRTRTGKPKVKKQ